MSTETPRRRRAQKAKGSSPVIPILVAVLVLLGGAWAAKSFLVGDTGGAYNILLMGVDEDKTRTDVVILAHLEPAKNIANFISIPRDTYVNIPCEGLEVCVSADKLNHAHVYGGPELTVKAVEGFLGVDIDSYVRVDFEGFAKVVDVLGGVDIVIDQDMYYEDPTPPGLVINFKASPEPQHLNGTQALKYVRFRNDGLGDVGRTERTRKFLSAIAHTMRESGKITKLPALISTMMPYVKTDIQPGTAVALAKSAAKFDPDQIHMAMIPGHDGKSPSGLWIWNADVPKTQELVDTLIKNPQPPAEQSK